MTLSVSNIIVEELWPIMFVLTCCIWFAKCGAVYYSLISPLWSCFLIVWSWTLILNRLTEACRVQDTLTTNIFSISLDSWPLVEFDGAWTSGKTVNGLEYFFHLWIIHCWTMDFRLVGLVIHLRQISSEDCFNDQRSLLIFFLLGTMLTDIWMLLARKLSKVHILPMVNSSTAFDSQHLVATYPLNAYGRIKVCGLNQQTDALENLNLN